MNFIEKIIENKFPYVIAEIGINHNGSVTLAKEMIDAAKENFADCVKFQLFIAEKYISENADKADYQKSESYANKTQRDIISESQITIDDVLELRNYAEKKNIDFLCTPFEENSLEKLIKANVEAIKVSSCNLTNYPFLQRCKNSNIPVLLSTGMATLDEVIKAFDIFGAEYPLLLFQCTSNYPSKIENSNINVLNTYKHLFKCPLGLSDHTKNNISAIAAVALGAKAVEKHFTLSRDLDGIDQKASINPDELNKLVRDLRECSVAMGDSLKFRSLEEENTFKSLRRSLVASRDIVEGETLKKDMVAIMRPGNGLTTEFLPKIIGCKLNKKIYKNHLFKLSDFF